MKPAAVFWCDSFVFEHFTGIFWPFYQLKTRWEMEKRERKRHTCRAPIVCGRFNTKETHSAEIVNYSSDGMCIKCDSLFKEKSTILFRRSGPSLGSENKGATARLRTISLAEVRWLKAAGSQNNRPFLVGVKFF
jgi:hypothetical protein